MKTLVSIAVGVSVALLTVIVLDYFHCREFTQGLWAGTFGCLTQSVITQLNQDERE